MSNPIVINKPNIETVSFDVYGTQPMIQHKWSEKAKKQMLDKQMKKASKGRDPKNPEQDFLDSLYLCSDGKHPDGPYGFPAVGFKSSAVRAAKQVEGMTMTDAKAWFMSFLMMVILSVYMDHLLLFVKTWLKFNRLQILDSVVSSMNGLYDSM